MLTFKWIIGFEELFTLPLVFVPWDSYFFLDSFLREMDIFMLMYVVLMIDSYLVLIFGCLGLEKYKEVYTEIRK